MRKLLVIVVATVAGVSCSSSQVDSSERASMGPHDCYGSGNSALMDSQTRAWVSDVYVEEPTTGVLEFLSPDAAEFLPDGESQPIALKRVDNDGKFFLGPCIGGDI